MGSDSLAETAGEYEAVQNTALGAYAMWAFVAEYSATNDDVRGPTLPLAMLVLPLVFHRDTLESIEDRYLNTGFYLALAENRSIPIGLQERMVAMAQRSLRSTRLALAAGLITYDPLSGEFFPGRRTSPPHVENSSLGAILKGSKRLGRWFASTSHEQLLNLLQVRF